jgi:hypothetical protein
MKLDSRVASAPGYLDFLPGNMMNIMHLYGRNITRFANGVIGFIYNCTAHFATVEMLRAQQFL